MKKANGKLNTGNYRPEQVKIGSGGLMDHVASADVTGTPATSGRLIAGNDTGPGPWILDGNSDTWRPGMRAGLGLALADIQTVSPAGSNGPLTVMGCPGVSISPDGVRGAIICMNWAWTCADLSAANPVWVKRINVGWNANGPLKSHNDKILIDPNNPSVIYVAGEAGYPAAGLNRSLDFGATWSTIASVPAPVSGGALIIALWRAGGTTSGRSDTVAVVSQTASGSAVLLSTNGGTSFASSTGGPSAGFSISYTAGGVLLITSTDQASTYRLASGSWTTKTINSYGYACHPTDATKVWSHFNGRLTPTQDQASTFLTETGVPKRVATDIGWMAWTNETNMGGGKVCWSPRFTGLVFAEGIGMWRSSNTSQTFTGTDLSFSWNEMSKGIENMVTNSISIEPASGDVLLGMHDRIGMQFSRATLTKAYASNHLNLRPNTTSGDPLNFGTVIVFGSNVTFAYDDPNWRAVQASTRTYYSADKFATPPTRTATDNGSLASNLIARNKGEMVAVGPSCKRPKYTADYGANWTPCNFGAGPNAQMDNVRNFNTYFLNRQVFARDETTGDLYFMCCGNDGGGDATVRAATAGTYRLPYASGIAGQWIRQNTTFPSADEVDQFGGALPANAYDSYNGHLRAVPGKTGHLFWAAGDTGGPCHLKFSPDGGQNYYRVGINAYTSGTGHDLTRNPMLFPIDVAFGITLPGRTYPTLIVTCSAFNINGLAVQKGITPVWRPHIFMIQDFDPASPSTCTIEPVVFDQGLIFPNGHPMDTLGVAAWSDSADFVVIYGNTGAVCLRYEDRASGT